MAKIWPVYGGKQQGSWGELPWPDCIEAFQLDSTCRIEENLTFYGDGKDGIFPDCVVIQIEEPEAGQNGEKPGYFASPLEGIGAKINLDRARNLLNQ